MKFKNNLFFLLLAVFMFNACQYVDQKATDEKPSDPPHTGNSDIENQQNSSISDAISDRLNAYYSDLSAENIEVNKYYAPTVNRFFNQSQLSREQISRSLQNGFESVENRSLSIDENSLQVSEEGSNYVATFSGRVDYTKSSDKKRVSESFKNQVTFNSELQIIGYESLASTQEAKPSNLPRKQTSKESSSKLSTESEQDRFSLRLSQFLQAWETGSRSKIQSFIDPQIGFYFINRPGAIDAVHQGKSFDEVFKKAYTPYAEKMLQDASCAAQFAPLPEFDCEGFSKNGCFISETTSYNRASQIMKALTKSKVGKFSQQMDLEVSRVEKRVGYQVLITDQAISMGWGKVNNQWYLLFLDIATYDCSA